MAVVIVVALFSVLFCWIASPLVDEVDGGVFFFAPPLQVHWHLQVLFLAVSANDLLMGAGLARSIFWASFNVTFCSVRIFWISYSCLKTGHCLDNAE